MEGRSLSIAQPRPARWVSITVQVVSRPGFQAGFDASSEPCRYEKVKRGVQKKFHVVILARYVRLRRTGKSLTGAKASCVTKAQPEGSEFSGLSRAWRASPAFKRETGGTVLVRRSGSRRDNRRAAHPGCGGFRVRRAGRRGAAGGASPAGGLARRSILAKYRTSACRITHDAGRSISLACRATRVQSVSLHLKAWSFIPIPRLYAV